MASKRVKIDSEVVYRSAPALQQKRFPSRRRSVRRRASNPPPQLRQQSTLTQLPEWSPSAEPSSDFEGDENGVGRPKPRRKRRKTVQDGKRQTTLTQMASSSFGQERYDQPQDDWMRHIQGEDEDADSDAEVVRDTQLPPRPHRSQDNQAEGRISEPGYAHEELEDDDDRYERMKGVASQEIGDDMVNRACRETIEEEAERIDSARGKPQWQQQQQEQQQQQRQEQNQGQERRPSPELPVSTSRLRTPRRRFASEIPSSNTPQSALLSMEWTRHSPVPSPLTARSTNATSPRPSPSKTWMSPVPESPTRPVHIQPLFRVPQKPPTLQHQRSTIPDSEDTATQITPFKQSKFQSQIPDTQFDMFGEEVGPTTETQFPSYSYTQMAGGTYDLQHYYQSYDPVCSALDRDAARFMQTQRLLDMRRSEALNQDINQPQFRSEDRFGPIQRSQELGEDPEMLSTHKIDFETGDEDAPTQSAPPTPQALPTQLGDIEEMDLTVVGPTNATFEVIRIPSSPTSKSVSSGKYPSSPPLTDVKDSPKTSIPETDKIDGASKEHSPTPRSSSPLPVADQLELVPHPSQISTVGGTQPWPLAEPPKSRLAIISSSPPALPPSTSSPPPEARRYLGKFIGIPDSEDEDELESFPHDDSEAEDQELDFWADRHRTDIQVPNDDSGDERTGNRPGLRDILPDTLLDFSLPPPPPTQSSLKSAGARQ